MKISARNSIPGIIKELENKGLIAVVRVEPSESVIVTAVITREAAEQLKLKKNDKVKVVVKPTEVMIKNTEE